MLIGDNMKPIEERNLVWNLSEFLDPTGEDEIIFGNFIKGHPMCFSESLSELVAELTRKLPSNYVIAKCYEIGTGDAVIGITKIN